MGHMYRLLCSCLGVVCLVPTLFSADLYVAPTGTSNGDGSVARPLDLGTALSGPLPKPGDTVWLRGGVYAGAFGSGLKGQSGLPITVRQYPGERATIDGSLSQTNGGWVNYWGFEVMNSYPTRVSTQAGSSPTDLPIHDAIDCTVGNVKFINLTVHDCPGNGFGLWLLAPNTEVYGCLIYYNGWQGPDRAHGHGYYGQNQTGSKVLADNLVFSQYGNGIQLYGSSSSFLYNFQITGNTFFNSGIIAANNSGGNNVTLEGTAPAQGIVFNGNATYHRIKTAGSISAGVPDHENADLQIINNYLVGRLLLQNWHSLTFTGNYLAANIPFSWLVQSQETYSTANVHWDSNQYQADVNWYPFKFQTNTTTAGQYFLPDWRSASGLDSASTYAYGAWTGSKVIIRPNQYEPSRANITVFNWDKLSKITVDLSPALAVGTPYEIRNAQDFFAAPVLTGVFDGNPVNLPMTGLTVATPIGQAAGPAPAAEFNAFVVLAVAATNGTTVPGGSFANSGAISIPSIGSGNPYPSPINVSGVSGKIAKVTVSVNGFSHSWPNDVGILLVAPGGQAVPLMANAGAGNKVSNVNLTFDDAATLGLPSSGAITSGTYLPTSYGAGKVFALPAPAGPYSSKLAVFNGLSPNGTWSLYLVDSVAGDSGMIAAGWNLSLSTTDPATDLTVACPSPPTALVGQSVAYAFTVTNQGPIAATGVMLTNILPASVQLGGVTLSQGSYSAANGTVLCSLGTVPAGTAVNVAIDLTPTVAGTLIDQAVVGLNEIDSSPAGNSVVVSSLVIPNGTYQNAAPISIPLVGTGTPYPSTINVSGLSGLMSKVTLTVSNLSHTWPDDVGLLVVSPSGQPVILMSSAGGGNKLANVTLTFDDFSGSILPDSGQIVSGSYRPATYGTAKVFPAPAPARAFGTTLSVLNGLDPNGTWSICVVDSANGDAGSITGGWSLTIATANVATLNFSNTSLVTIPSIGNATPYPSLIPVSGIAGNILKLTATVTGLSHTWPKDIGILLVGPGGQDVVLMASVGAGNKISNVTLTFDDAATGGLPAAAQIVSGTYKPTVSGTGKVFVSPAPAAPYGSALSVFNGLPANGNWSLYVLDNAAGDSGSIASGWTLSFLTSGSAMASLPVDAPVSSWRAQPMALVGAGEPVTIPRLLHLAVLPDGVNGLFRVEFKSALDGPAVIEASSDLVSWLPIYTNAPGQPPAELLDLSSPSQARRFYRARSGDAGQSFSPSQSHVLR